MANIQQQLASLQTSVKRQRLLNIGLLGIMFSGGLIAAVRPAGDATFDMITCKGWKVVDADGKVRIASETNDNGKVGVAWYDQNGTKRIVASTYVNGDASVTLMDKDGVRIVAAILADGSVSLPTKDLTPPKKP
ncbi:MAG: hypothetical protein K8R92_09375 [Planctomycetes bacterium]|nr:hypothetical protein [Planctomycetota bacterium]